jgi:hypothetical protein
MNLFAWKWTKVPDLLLAHHAVLVALKDRFETELDRLEELDVITSVSEPTEWVNQFVVAEKSTGKLRVCLDPAQLNKLLKRKHYHLPVIDDVLPQLSKAKVFTKLYLANGYWHCELDYESSLLTTFQTSKGQKRWSRPPFGLAVSSEIFQIFLPQALEGLPGVLFIADDVFVYGVGDNYDEAVKNHDKNLDMC